MERPALTMSASKERGTVGPAPVAPREGPNDTLSGSQDMNFESLRFTVRFCRKVIGERRRGRHPRLMVLRWRSLEWAFAIERRAGEEPAASQ